MRNGHGNPRYVAHPDGSRQSAAKSVEVTDLPGSVFLFFLPQKKTQAMPEVSEGRELGKEGEQGPAPQQEVKQVAPEPTGKFGEKFAHQSHNPAPFEDQVTQEIVFLACARFGGHLNWTT